MSADAGRLVAAGLAVAAGDPEANRVVYGVVIALIVIGLVLIGVAVWVIRQTRVDPELLAPLERMSDRSWKKRDPATQRRMLDEVRPAEAMPLHRAPSEPEPDLEFDQARPVSSFDDLKDPQPDETADAASGEADGEVEGEDGEDAEDGEPASEEARAIEDEPVTDGESENEPATEGEAGAWPAPVMSPSGEESASAAEGERTGDEQVDH